MVEGGIRDYQLAKRKAQERLGLSVKGALLPRNDEIEREVIEYQRSNDYILAAEPIETASGTIEAGTIALNHYRHAGKTREGTEIVQEQIWYMDDIKQNRLESKMDLPRESGWRIKIEGDVNLIVDVDFPPDLSQEEHVAQGMSTTAFHLVNAVPPVCQAQDPGIKTYLDLPMITGCMGTHTTTR